MKVVDPGFGDDVLSALYAVYIDGRRTSDTAELWGVQYQKIYSAAKRFEIALAHARRIKKEDLTRGISY